MQLVRQPSKGMISGAVATEEIGADPFGEGKDLCVGLIVEVEAADQGFYFFIRESRGDLTDNGIGAAVGTAVEDHKAVRCVEETLFVGEEIRLPTPFSFRYVLPDSFFPVPESYAESDKPRHMGKSPRRRA